MKPKINQPSQAKVMEQDRRTVGLESAVCASMALMELLGSKLTSETGDYPGARGAAVQSGIVGLVAETTRDLYESFYEGGAR